MTLASSNEKNTGSTPGPWYIREPQVSRSIHVIDGPDGKYVCQLPTRTDIRTTQECEANARLVAASPDLLASCIELRDVLNHDCGATEEEHLYEHIGPATIRASATITKVGVVEP